MSRRTFAAALQQSHINIPLAGLLFAREIAYPNLDVGRYVAQFKELADEAQKAVSPANSGRADALATFLFREQGFRGNAAAYGDPRNSYLNEVLDRRLGIPISLSVVYLAVAERVGLTAYGVGLPGHFIVGVRERTDEVLLDPFHGGERLELADCERLVQETTGFAGRLDPAWLHPADPHAMLARMLNNLRLIYVQREQWSKSLAVVERLHQVQPGVPEHLRDLGLIHFQRGEFYAAARYLEAFLEAAPETPEAAAIKDNLSSAFARWARLN